MYITKHLIAPCHSLRVFQFHHRIVLAATEEVGNQRLGSSSPSLLSNAPSHRHQIRLRRSVHKSTGHPRLIPALRIAQSPGDRLREGESINPPTPCHAMPSPPSLSVRRLIPLPSPPPSSSPFHSTQYNTVYLDPPPRPLNDQLNNYLTN